MHIAVENKPHFVANYLMTIAYDGTQYSGWQVQPNAVSIQEIIEKALALILRYNVRLIGSGRTDAGVHALGQKANFKTTSELEIDIFLHKINGLLPKDIRILEMRKVSLDFHSQYSSLGKVYHYHICLQPVVMPFVRLYSTYHTQKINLETLREAATIFLGTHDFSAFANSQHEGSAGKNAVRTIQRLDIFETEQGIRLEFEADGFLYKMVRNIVGLLLDISSGKRPLTDIDMLFQVKDRRLASKSAPAKGLFLVHVFYDL